MDKATFAAGCFWGVEDAFRRVEGVHATRVGYCGGVTNSPSYGEVCTGKTGHAEAVEVSFDPGQVSYEQLLEIFWQSHDPTQLNRQGPDRGSQYRSAIFFHSPAQQLAAEQSLARLESSGALRNSIVTEIVPAETFWQAEEYHQQYHLKQGGSCRY
jgi:peptide-methionine (S)-S-oxide reductase